MSLSRQKSVKRTFTPADIFSVNNAFNAKLKRITVNTLQKKETAQETENVHDKILQDRKCIIDAAIVRTMKARRTVIHNDLVTEVIRLVRFPLDI
jgi:hypothetical protein